MNKISFRKIMIERNQKLISLLSGLSISSNEQMIHKIRVEIKKINALIQLFHFNKKKLINKKTKRKLHQLFQKAGKIRSYQVELKKLKKYYPKLNLYSYRKLIVQKQKKQELDLLKKINVTRLNIKFSRHSTTKLSINQIASFLMSCYKKLENPQLKNSKIHNIRRQLKNALYITDFIKSVLHELNNSKQKKIIQIIGRWHDLISIKKSITNEIKKNRKNMIYKNLDIVIDNLNKRISNEKRKIELSFL